MHVAFTAHSIPISMARNCKYEHQLTEACRLVAEETRHCRRIDGRLSTRAGAAGRAIRGSSRISSIISKTYGGVGSDSVLIHPVGFLSDHMEVMYDLDEEARLLCEELGLTMVRARTVGTHPRFISHAPRTDRRADRISEEPGRRAVGGDGPSHDVCPETAASQ